MRSSGEYTHRSQIWSNSCAAAALALKNINKQQQHSYYYCCFCYIPSNPSTHRLRLKYNFESLYISVELWLNLFYQIKKKIDKLLFLFLLLFSFPYLRWLWLLSLDIIFYCARALSLSVIYYEFFLSLSLVVHHILTTNGEQNIEAVILSFFLFFFLFPISLSI